MLNFLKLVQEILTLYNLTHLCTNFVLVLYGLVRSFMNLFVLHSYARFVLVYFWNTWKLHLKNLIKFIYFCVLPNPNKNKLSRVFIKVLKLKALMMTKFLTHWPLPCQQRKHVQCFLEEKNSHFVHPDATN